MSSNVLSFLYVPYVPGAHMSHEILDLDEILRNPPKTLDEANALLQRLATETKSLRATAYTDALTKLQTRQPFLDRLDRELRVAQSFVTGKRAPRNAGIESVAVVSGDLVGLRDLNNRLGHGAGDGLLTQTARGLERAVRTNDLVARWGGDEFMLALWNAAANDAEVILKRVQANVNAIGDGMDIRLGCVIWSRGSSRASAQDLIEAADQNELVLHSTDQRGSLITLYTAPRLVDFSPLTPHTTKTAPPCCEARRGARVLWRIFAVSPSSLH